MTRTEVLAIARGIAKEESPNMATKARTAWKKAVKMYGVYLGGKLCAIRDTKIRALAAAWSVSDDAVVRAVLVTPAHKGKP